MKGYEITFFTQQDRQHGRQLLAEWLVELAKKLGLRGATMSSAAEGFGQSGRIRSAHFFELSDQPLQVVMVATEDEAAKLFDALRLEKVDLFYVRTPAEFGHIADLPA